MAPLHKNLSKLLNEMKSEAPIYEKYKNFLTLFSQIETDYICIEDLKIWAAKIYRT